MHEYIADDVACTRPRIAHARYNPSMEGEVGTRSKLSLRRCCQLMDAGKKISFVFLKGIVPDGLICSSRRPHMQGYLSSINLT